MSQNRASTPTKPCRCTLLRLTEHLHPCMKLTSYTSCFPFEPPRKSLQALIARAYVYETTDQLRTQPDNWPILSTANKSNRLSPVLQSALLVVMKPRLGQVVSATGGRTIVSSVKRSERRNFKFISLQKFYFRADFATAFFTHDCFHMMVMFNLFHIS